MPLFWPYRAARAALGRLHHVAARDILRAFWRVLNPMADQSDMAKKKEEAEQARLDRTYNTISFCSWVILPSWIVFLIAVGWNADWAAPKYIDLTGLLITLAWGILAGITSKLETNTLRLPWQEKPLPKNFRKGALWIITSLVLLVIGVMISFSGGSVNSGFSHFLIATASIAVLMAVEPWVRILIVIIAAALYLTCLWPFMEPMIPLTHTTFWKGFNGVSMVWTMGLSTAAAWRGFPRKDAPEGPLAGPPTQL